MLSVCMIVCMQYVVCVYLYQQYVLMKYRGGKEGREKEQIEVRGKGGLRCVCEVDVGCVRVDELHV